MYIYIYICIYTYIYIHIYTYTYIYRFIELVLSCKGYSYYIINDGISWPMDLGVSENGIWGPEDLSNDGIWYKYKYI